MLGLRLRTHGCACRCPSHQADHPCTCRSDEGYLPQTLTEIIGMGTSGAQPALFILLNPWVGQVRLGLMLSHCMQAAAEPLPPMAPQRTPLPNRRRQNLGPWRRSDLTGALLGLAPHHAKLSFASLAGSKPAIAG